MSLQELAGNSAVTITLFIISLIIAGGLFLATLFTVIYHRFLYPRKMRPSYDESYQPRCSIILPCKGIPVNFEQNILSFFKLDYKEYNVIFTVESEQDPCVPILKNIITREPRASLTVARITTTCCQKNHNMIAALDKADNPDVYVFADSDIQLSKNWLHELVLPLSNPAITVSSGFRWLFSSTGKIGELANAYQNAIILVLFSVASFVQDVGLWGGSMAMRKKDFDELGVKECWAETVVDDISLSQIIMKNSKKSVMVSPCIIPSDDALQTVSQSTNWFVRQVMFLKAYQRISWSIAIPIATLGVFYQVYLPVSLLLSITTSKTFIGLGGIASLVFVFGVMLSAFLYPLLGKLPQFWRFILLQPLLLCTITSGVIKTLFTNTVKWSGFIYKLNFRGKVVSVEHQ